MKNKRLPQAWSLKLFIVISLTIGLLGSCKDDGVLINSANESSIALNATVSLMFGYKIDPTKNYVYVEAQDGFGGTSILKINTQTLLLEETYENSNGFLGFNNLFVNRTSQFYNAQATRNGEKMWINHFSEDLTLLDTDTLNTKIDAFKSLRPRICEGPSGQIALALNLYDSKNRAYVKFSLMNKNFETTKEVIDTSFSAYFQVIYGSQFYPTSDGGYVYVARQRKPPYYDYDILIEKRDANFNLLWRKQITGDGDQNSDNSMEIDGKVYLYTQNTDVDNGFQKSLSITVYGIDGTTILNSDNLKSGGLDETTSYACTPAENGNFLFCAKTSLGVSDFNNRKYIVYHTDSEFNVLNTTIYGGAQNVNNGGIVKLEANKYLLLFNDSGFSGDDNKMRLVLKLIDGTGKQIK